MAYFRKVPAKNKKGYTYSFTIELGKDPITGKRKQVTRRGFETKKEAEVVANELENQINKNTFILDSNVLLSSHVEKWLDLVAKRKVKETTFKNYRRVVKNKIIPLLGHFNLNEIKPAHIEHFIAKLLDEGLSERYIEYIFVVLYGSMEKAVDWELINKNPLDKVKVPRGRRRKYVTWTREEVNKFLNVAKFVTAPVYHAIFTTALYTGMRRGELLGLKWKDVDFDDSTIHVRRNLIYDDEGFRFGTLKTELSERDITIEDYLIECLKSYRIKQLEVKMGLGKLYDDQDLIFARQDGRPIYPRTLTENFNRATKEAALPKIRIHDCRHTHATLLLEAGVSLKEVQERLGHSSIKMTGDIYAHVTPKIKARTAKKFGDYMKLEG